MGDQETISDYNNVGKTTLQFTSERYFRKLGVLETESHRYHQLGIDITSQLFQMESTKAVTPCNLTLALRCLSKRHPLLRACIIEKTDSGSSSFHFVEMEQVSVDFAIIDRDDWETVLDEEVSHQFNVATGPLWRCRLLRNRVSPALHDEGFKYNSVLTLTWHHGIFDAMYLQTVFGDLVKFLDDDNLDGSTFDSTDELPLHLPIENLLQDVLISTKFQNGHNVSIESIDDSAGNNIRQALDAYIECNAYEIAQLSLVTAAPRTIQVELTRDNTDGFIQSCRTRNVSVTGAIIAASCLSLNELICSRETDHKKSLHIPLEFLADTRQYLDVLGYTRTMYSGLAAIHLPNSLTIHSSHKHADDNTFWKYARTSTTNIRKTLQSNKPMDILRTTIKEHSNSSAKIPRGKSPNVLSVSNVGKSNDFVRKEQVNDFKIRDILGATSILNDDMPVFFVALMTIHGRMKGYVSYCANFTSEETASKFTKRLCYYITRQSKSRL